MKKYILTQCIFTADGDSRINSWVYDSYDETLDRIKEWEKSFSNNIIEAKGKKNDWTLKVKDGSKVFFVKIQITEMEI